GFFLRPRPAAGAGPPAQPASPPADSPSGIRGGAGHGPTPTPIGGGSRQPAEQPAPAARRPAAGGAAAPRSGGAAPGPSAGPAPAAQVTGASGTAAATPAPRVVTPPISPEEARRKVAAYLAEGRKLQAQGKWREAKDALDVAAALDPVNFEVKEVADQVQAKLEEAAKAKKEFDQAAALFADKDYQNALWKLYRL